jgi:hypothetical protein
MEKLDGATQAASAQLHDGMNACMLREREFHIGRDLGWSIRGKRLYPLSQSWADNRICAELSAALFAEVGANYTIAQC